jgi:hypothetical protein
VRKVHLGWPLNRIVSRHQFKIPMRTHLRNLALISALLFVASCSTATNPVRPQEFPELVALEAKLVGDWEGTIKRKGDRQTESPLRILITRDQARVFHRKGDAWIEAKPGQFRISRLGPNAVLSATDSGRDDESLWVETWVLALTLHANDRLLVEFVRVVHNTELPESVAHKRFSFGAFGIFDRRPGGG